MKLAGSQSPDIPNPRGRPALLRFAGGVLALTAAATIAGEAIAQAASPSVVHAVREIACAHSKEQWQQAETVDESLGEEPSYSVHHTVCDFQFVAGGRWHNIEYRHVLQVSRRWGWSEVRDNSLSVMILQLEGIDVASDIYRWVMADRGCRGRVSFAVRDALGAVSTADHFYLPPEDDAHDGGDGCIGHGCKPVGLQNRDQWQQFYELALLDALSHFGTSAVRRGNVRRVKASFSVEKLLQDTVLAPLSSAQSIATRHSAHRLQSGGQK